MRLKKVESVVIYGYGNKAAIQYTKKKVCQSDDLNEWITWFLNVIRKLNKEECSEFIK